MGVSPEDKTEGAADTSSNTVFEKFSGKLPRFESIVSFVFIYALFSVFLFVFLGPKLLFDLIGRLSSIAWLVLILISVILWFTLNKRESTNSGDTEKLTFRLLLINKPLIAFTVLAGILLIFLDRPFRVFHDDPMAVIVTFILYLLPIPFVWQLPLGRSPKFYLSLVAIATVWGIKLLTQIALIAASYLYLFIGFGF